MVCPPKKLLLIEFFVFVYLLDTGNVTDKRVGKRIKIPPIAPISQENATIRRNSLMNVLDTVESAGQIIIIFFFL